MKNLNVCFRGKTFWKQENLFGNDKALRAERFGNDMDINSSLYQAVLAHSFRNEIRGKNQQQSDYRLEQP